MKRNLIIFFCPECNWNLINPEDSDKTNKCPKCNSWLYEISQLYYYIGKKEIAREFSLSDNDEVYFGGYDFETAKKLINKAFKLFEENQRGEIK